MATSQVLGFWSKSVGVLIRVSCLPPNQQFLQSPATTAEGAMAKQTPVITAGKSTCLEFTGSQLCAAAGILSAPVLQQQTQLSQRPAQWLYICAQQPTSQYNDYSGTQQPISEPRSYVYSSNQQSHRAPDSDDPYDPSFRQPTHSNTGYSPQAQHLRVFGYGHVHC